MNGRRGSWWSGWVRLAALIAALGLAAACTLLSGLDAPPKLYRLSPKSTFAPDLPKASWQLLVDQPIAPAGIDTSRIALGPSALTLDYFAGVSWTDSAPQMVQTLLIQSFENTGKIISVGRESSLLRADFILLTELRQFQADYSQSGENKAPTVRARVNLKLVKMPEREIVAGETFEASVPAAGNSLAEIVDAFDEASGKVMRRTVEWTLRQGAKTYTEERQAPARDGRRDRGPPRGDGQTGAPAG